jgi:hypothetical protein
VGVNFYTKLSRFEPREQLALAGSSRKGPGGWHGPVGRARAAMAPLR